MDCDRHLIKINQKETHKSWRWISKAVDLILLLWVCIFHVLLHPNSTRAPWPQGRTWLRERNCGATITSESRVYESRNSCCLFNPPYALSFCMCFSLYSVCVGNRSKMMNECQRWCDVFLQLHTIAFRNEECLQKHPALTCLLYANRYRWFLRNQAGVNLRMCMHVFMHTYAQNDMDTAVFRPFPGAKLWNYWV